LIHGFPPLAARLRRLMSIVEARILTHSRVRIPTNGRFIRM
jgi:hypothetical protein